MYFFPMTVLPTFYLTGILAIILGLITIIWSLCFVHHRYGGQVLILLSIALLLFGGGIFPPLIGIIGGTFGTHINKPLSWWRSHLSGRPLLVLVKLWPWTIILFFVWLAGQWIVGALFPDLMLALAWFNILWILVLLVLTPFTALASDIYDDTSNL